MRHRHGRDCHVLEDDGYFSAKTTEKTPKKTPACDPDWERDTSVDLDVGNRNIDARVRTRRIMGSIFPDGHLFGFTLEERAIWEKNLDDCWMTEDSSLSELLDHRGPSPSERRSGFAEAANSRKFMQKPHESVELQGKELLRMFQEGGSIPTDVMRDFMVKVALDLCISKNPASRAKGLSILEKWYGGAATGDKAGEAERELGI